MKIWETQTGLMNDGIELFSLGMASTKGWDVLI